MQKSNAFYNHYYDKILKKNNVSDYGSNKINGSYSTGNYEEYLPEHDSRIFKWRKESVNGNANAIIGGLVYEFKLCSNCFHIACLNNW